jgi:hypothetical protein
LMQDRYRQIAKTSCDARPDHTSGSNSTDLRCPRNVGFTPDCGRIAANAAKRR